MCLQVWDVRSTECVRSFLPPQLNLVTDTACYCARFLPMHRDRLLVCNGTSSLYVMSITGEVRCGGALCLLCLLWLLWLLWVADVVLMCLHRCMPCCRAVLFV